MISFQEIEFIVELKAKPKFPDAKVTCCISIFKPKIDPKKDTKARKKPKVKFPVSPPILLFT